MGKPTVLGRFSAGTKAELVILPVFILHKSFIIQITLGFTKFNQNDWWMGKSTRHGVVGMYGII